MKRTITSKIFHPAWLLVLALNTACADSDAKRIHEEALVIDTHSDFLYRADLDGSALTDEPPLAQTTMGKLEQGGVDAQFFSVWIPPEFRDYGYARKTLELIDDFYRQIGQTPERIEMATTVADIKRIAASGKVAALMGIEGGHSIENRLELLRNYYRLGVRYMTLTWSNNTDWADSSGDVVRSGGLTDFGVSVVEEMNRIGMMIDISHVADTTFYDVMRATSAPVIASHSSVRAFSDHKRNMSDQMIVALAENGGVIQINFFPMFIDQEFYDAAIVAQYEAKPEFATLATEYLDDPIGLLEQQWTLSQKIMSTLESPPLSVLVDHIDHVVKLVGPDHVGLGSDFDGVSALPIGMEHQGKLPALTEALVEKGYSEEDIKKILGGNLLRVMAEVERVSAEMSAN
ncbi:MAG: dipeptidase [Gammaproteobacteria bacterium]|nr:dipeptidase [Gammaproteobacteria bacterium]